MNKKSIFRHVKRGSYCVLLFALLMLLALPAAAQQQMRKAERQLAEHMNHHEMVKADFRATPSFAGTLAAQPTMASNPRKAAPPRRATDYTGGVYDMLDAYVDADRTTTICNGTATHNSIPFRTYYFDTEETSSQMIYPASMLTALKPGDKIKSITFYTNNSTINQRLGTARVDVRIGETTATTISNSKDDMDSKRGGITGSFSSYLTTGSNTVTITFTKPYTWNGGNLIIDTYVVIAATQSTQGNNYSKNWQGQQGFSNGVSACNYNTTSLFGSSSNFSRARFLPKMTIAYTTKVKSGQTKGHVTYDKPFFDGIDYDWVDSNGNEKTSTLGDVATEPEQIIAMLREVYMNKDIPGNFKRGFDVNGNDEPYNDVAYTGVGGISHSGNNFKDASYYSWNNSYGWNVPGNIVYSYDIDFRADYAHMDSTQYKPDYDGLTLLLIEMKDDFDLDHYYDDWNNTTFNTYADVLKYYISHTIKSARIVSQAKRTGTGFDAGTLFKIDCDKMNKFFMLAKGQMRYLFNSQEVFADSTFYYPRATFCRLPLYARSEYSDVYYRDDEQYTSGGFLDDNSFEPFYHMFEQFSPYGLTNLQDVLDVYQDMVNMKSFGVEHDCASIPVVSPKGHHFRMYGEDSGAADCQDVRDMMFFVPDYRMMWHDKRNSGADFLNYHPAHRPTVGLYVIQQDPIQGEEVKQDEMYKLTLTWDSNMNSSPIKLGQNRPKQTLNQIV